MNQATQADSRPIVVCGADDFAACPDCGHRLETDLAEMARDDDGPIYFGSCPAHGGFRWQVQGDGPACPNCGNVAVYARLDAQWSDERRAWLMLPFHGDHPFACTECDAEMQPRDSGYPTPDFAGLTHRTASDVAAVLAKVLPIIAWATSHRSDCDLLPDEIRAALARLQPQGAGA